MNSIRLLFVCALGILIAPSLALAGEKSPVDWARTRVQHGLVRPLNEKQASAFSRMRPEPRERRIRILSATTSADHNGHHFVAFAVDMRHGGDWKDDIIGCVYKTNGDIYVKRGEAYRPAEFLLGKNVEPVPGVCVAAASS